MAEVFREQTAEEIWEARGCGFHANSWNGPERPTTSDKARECWNRGAARCAAENIQHHMDTQKSPFVSVSRWDLNALLATLSSAGNDGAGE